MFNKLKKNRKEVRLIEEEIANEETKKNFK